ncbi:Ger(x)C family spore germination protein [Paenibacillus sp.]|uniref:Ger(x)C family spore germination protein n=1 Tax=Paenibacillus sp. TaxID=58172 RepID=UPI002D4AA338|nr:Ger(x)C family spore germination protein [Paenibacillus sp.]HZG87738.1 Ger(x)C family spore germination protein [Paenibacillus sp.]
MRGAAAVSLCVCMALLLTGCWDRREINDVAFVVGTAIDLEKDGYRGTLQIPLVGQMGGPQGGGGGTSGSKAWHIESAFGKTIRGATEALQDHLSRVLNFSHRRVFVIGMPLASQGVMPFFDAVFRIPQNRLSAFPLVAIGDAKDILTADAPIEKMPAEMLREVAQLATVDPINLRIFFYSLLTEGIDPIAPAVKRISSATNIKKSKSTIELAGVALFRHDRLAAILSEDDALGLLIAMNQARSPLIDVKPPHGAKGTIMIQLQQSITSIEPKVKGARIGFDVTIMAHGNVAEKMSDYPTSTTVQRDALERAVESRLTKMVEHAIRESQRHQSDPIGFGDALHRKQPRVWKDVRGRWEREELPRADIRVRARVHLEHDGALTKSLEQMK